MPTETTPSHVCVAVIEYQDRTEGRLLHQGDEAACRQVSDMMPAVSVSGPTRPRQAFVAVMTAAEYADMLVTPS